LGEPPVRHNERPVYSACDKFAMLRATDVGENRILRAARAQSITGEITWGRTPIRKSGIAEGG